MKNRTAANNKAPDEVRDVSGTTIRHHHFLPSAQKRGNDDVNLRLSWKQPVCRVSVSGQSKPDNLSRISA